MAYTRDEKFTVTAVAGNVVILTPGPATEPVLKLTYPVDLVDLPREFQLGVVVRVRIETA